MSVFLKLILLQDALLILTASLLLAAQVKSPSSTSEPSPLEEGFLVGRVAMEREELGQPLTEPFSGCEHAQLHCSAIA